MSSEHLRKFFDNATRDEVQAWIKMQTQLAAALCNRLRRHLADTSIELPEPGAIVNETIVRIMDDREKYVWDGTGRFDVFFRRCMATSRDALRSAVRKHRIASNKFVPDTDLYTGAPNLKGPYEWNEKRDDDIAMREDSKRVLATVIVTNNRMGTTLKTYIHRLPEYARQKMTVEEIAAELGVKPGSIDPYRMRARNFVMKGRIVVKKKESIEVALKASLFHKNDVQNEVMYMTKGAFTIDRVVRAIQEGEMPDGREIHDDEAYLDALAVELEKLDPDDLEAVMEATGCDVAAAEATAERLSDLLDVPTGKNPLLAGTLSVPVCTATSDLCGFSHGFSLAHEVLLSNLAVACNGVIVLSGKETRVIQSNGQLIPLGDPRSRATFHPIADYKVRVVIDGQEAIVSPSKENKGLAALNEEAFERVAHLLASTRRDRHADIDGD